MGSSPIDSTIIIKTANERSRKFAQTTRKGNTEMDNQHKQIKGYRDLTQDEIDLMNEAKAIAEQVGQFIEKLSVTHAQTGNHQIDGRWLSIAKTDLQKGFMFLIRAIAQPTTF